MARVAEISPKKKIKKIEYGVHPSFYEVPRAPIFECPRFLYVGGLNRLKGVDVLVEMLKRYPKRSWKMIFIGDGYLMESLKELNDPSIEILGMLKTDKVQAEMSKSWGLVVPSRADTSPNVVKEARVIGLPVIGSPNGGHAEYITHGMDGLLVESENPDEWFNAINLLSNSFQTCIEFGKYNHEHFQKYFQPEKTAAEFLNLYRELL
jgi:glycosyltransferase involved in cell wall biosynthesis